ncbi:MAG TPA: exodeoxyribonuclease VII large subunit [Candidatus Accumulibacter phosphatis]|nr:MAG: Exodeoxyribonuclease 7 large subunit [Candidatus Accumulibacter sp. SK-11]HAY26357.1 exodeoxyribonuclease VII large subunit [Accumulibacter sp.]HCN68126.1 exodeoxyribonuclease VII large subunit [Accumulibacter sp.]HRL76113.1 exodeoxyribonuclease VII large subunit [Candidatus Accumulibacter phosphatis]HRQ94508.1 exodeoxyribonuclease VII large subunit [Candidatus Accumulibacter phosphatis]
MADSLFGNAAFDPTPAVIPVSLLNRLARERLETAFPLCWVAGEVSNLSHAASGHVYFSLKDSAAQVRCVMFRNRAQLLGWRLQSGQHIEARVLVTLYEARGDFQLNVEAARHGGLGNLYERFLRLKEKLEREGLFDSGCKRPLPAFPRRIGIVTSPQAAALRDVLSTLRRRAGQVRIVVYPTPVQGEGAAALIAESIRRAGERAECDLLILCRGGGSLEDLWAFNDEAVARAIHACPLPVISGIGHETDFTIADLAADQRAATPTAAAEMAAPERSALLARLATDRLALRRQIEQLFNQRAQHLDWLARRLQHPGQHLARQKEALRNLQRRLDTGLLRRCTLARAVLSDLGHRLQRQRPAVAEQTIHLQSMASRLERAERRTLDDKAGDLSRLAAGLSHLNPRAVLARGYSIVSNRHGEIVDASSALEPGEEIAVFFHRGRADARVLAVAADDGEL